mmetsp:Transcript_62885/g.153114  ORF Transcript_62885/g.153114 Transcript_62885/m.153114 type:complete len:82 (+) Transcript_62885:529-774(+)
MCVCVCVRERERERELPRVNNSSIEQRAADQGQKRPQISFASTMVVYYNRTFFLLFYLMLSMYSKSVNGTQQHNPFACVCF